MVRAMEPLAMVTFRDSLKTLQDQVALLMGDVKVLTGSDVPELVVSPSGVTHRTATSQKTVCGWPWVQGGARPVYSSVAPTAACQRCTFSGTRRTKECGVKP